MPTQVVQKRSLVHGNDAAAMGCVFAALCDPIPCSVCCRDRIVAPGPHDDKARLARNLMIGVAILLLIAMGLGCHLCGARDGQYERLAADDHQTEDYMDDFSAADDFDDFGLPDDAGDDQWNGASR